VRVKMPSASTASPIGAAVHSRPAARRTSFVPVQSVVRALALLEALGDSRSDVGIAALAKRVGLHVSTVHRLLTTLLAQGYARQDPESGRYALGGKAFHLAESYLRHLDFRQVARPVLQDLSQATGETANLVTLDGHEALYLDKAESSRSLQIFSRIGRRAPLHCTAAGKVLLAFRDGQADALLARGPLERLTKRTITAPGDFRHELAKVRQQGFALDLEECEAGGRCIAAPIHGVLGQAMAAVSISGPSVRMSMRRVQELVPVVTGAARRISEELGWSGAQPQGARGRSSSDGTPKSMQEPIRF